MAKENSSPQHQDYFGRELAEGDFVVFSVSNLFQVGRIARVTNKMIRVVGYDYPNKHWRTGEAAGNLKYSHECLKVDEAEVTMYLLKKPLQ
jgi:hypothetical protein